MEPNASIRDRISKQFCFQRLLRGVFDRPVPVVIAVLALTIALASFIPQLSFNTSIYDLVIEDLPETEVYNTFKEQFGCEEIIRVVIKSDNVYDPVAFKKIEEISDALTKVPGVRRVISLLGVKNAIAISGKWDMVKFQKILAPVDLFRKNLISDDHKTTAISLILENEADREAVIQAVNAVITTTERSLSLYQIGMPLVSQALAIFTQKDFSRLPPITFLIIAMVLLILFRNLPGFILPLVCVSLALVWTFGFMALAGVPISMVTVIVPVFLIAVGAAYCLHIITEYLFYAQGAASPKDALFLTFTRITFPTTLAVFTTVVGLGSLLVNRIPAIREFAIFSCFGILSLLIIVVTFVPAVLVLLPTESLLQNAIKALKRQFKSQPAGN